MYSHLIVFSTISIVRGLGGLLLAGWLIYFSMRENIPGIRQPSLKAGDLTAFLAIGYLVGALAVIRLSHGLSILWLAARSRRLQKGGKEEAAIKRLFQSVRRIGWGLSIVDLLDLTFFPITTGCGLYGLLVCRNAGVLDLTEGKELAASTTNP
ncbi:MAG: hypothetical protein HY717_04640 [Planctomycetes bacterium]|nr:hypothetical protein [Planctomycetota bacterium]